MDPHLSSWGRGRASELCFRPWRQNSSRNSPFCFLLPLFGLLLPAPSSGQMCGSTIRWLLPGTAASCHKDEEAALVRDNLLVFAFRVLVQWIFPALAIKKILHPTPAFVFSEKSNFPEWDSSPSEPGWDASGQTCSWESSLPFTDYSSSQTSSTYSNYFHPVWCQDREMSHPQGCQSSRTAVSGTGRDSWGACAGPRVGRNPRVALPTQDIPQFFFKVVNLVLEFLLIFHLPGDALEIIQLPSKTELKITAWSSAKARSEKEW